MTLREQLVGDTKIKMKKKTLKTTSSIIIATWLDELQESRQKIMYMKTTNIIWSYVPSEELREADEQFKKK